MHRLPFLELIFPCPSPITTTKCPGDYSTDSDKRALKIGKKARNLSIWGIVVSSLGFFPFHLLLALGARETYYLEPPKGLQNKKQNKQTKKCLLSLAKGPGKGKPNRDLVGLHTWGLVCSLDCPQSQQEQKSPWSSQPQLHNWGNSR